MGPGPYIIQSLKRDNPLFWRGDAFGLVLDPVNEKSNGFVFAVNPEAVQSESLVTGQTGRRGSSGSSSGVMDLGIINGTQRFKFLRINGPLKWPFHSNL